MGFLLVATNTISPCVYIKIIHNALNILSLGLGLA